jgi:CRP/FNR family cyclic AMP-dependent transcriptional regulator
MLERPCVQRFIEAANKRSLPPRQTLIREGEPARFLYLLLEGSVSILLDDDTGREVVLAYLDPGDFIGEMCLFPEQSLRTAIVRTRRATLVAEMPLDAFHRFAHEHPDIMFVIAAQLAARLRDTSQRVADLSFLDVAGRLARVLVELSHKPDAQPHQQGVTVKISRLELARHVGCSREMVGRVLKRLEEEGTVRSKGREILLLSGLRPG